MWSAPSKSDNVSRAICTSNQATVAVPGGGGGAGSLSLTGGDGGVIALGGSVSVSTIANGGTQPYTFVPAAPPLPGGITVSSSGVVSGMPTAPGNYAVAVKVTDSEAPPPALRQPQPSPCLASSAPRCPRAWHSHPTPPLCWQPVDGSRIPTPSHSFPRSERQQFRLDHRRRQRSRSLEYHCHRQGSRRTYRYSSRHFDLHRPPRLA